MSGRDVEGQRAFRDLDFIQTFISHAKRLWYGEESAREPTCDHDWERIDVQRKTSNYATYNEEEGKFILTTHEYCYSWECTECHESTEADYMSGPARIDGTKMHHVTEVVTEWEVDE